MFIETLERMNYNSTIQDTNILVVKTITMCSKCNVPYIVNSSKSFISEK